MSIVPPDFEGVSAREGLVYIARTRRQLDRLHCPHDGSVAPIDAAEAAATARPFDELEASLLSHYHNPA